MSGPLFSGLSNIVPIALPPGMDEPQKSMVDFSLCVTMVFGIIVWDYFVLLWYEIRLYRGTGMKMWKQPQPPAVAFLVLRYSGIITAFLALFLTTLPTQHCQFVASASQIGILLSVASSGIIFAYRVSALWGGKATINILVSFFYVAMLTCWVAIATQHRSSAGLPKAFGSNCINHPVPSWSVISNASSVLFDALILTLTLLKLNQIRTVQSNTDALLYRDCLLYFVVTTTTNVAVLIIQALPDTHALSKPQSLPFSFLLTVAMGSRVFINLQLVNERKERDDETGSLSPIAKLGAHEDFTLPIQYPPSSIRSSSHSFNVTCAAFIPGLGFGPTKTESKEGF